MINKKRFDEGLGTVYERFVLNFFFDSLIDAFAIKKVLEVPLYGMSGLTGINSVYFAKRGCQATLVDRQQEYTDETEELWKMLPYQGSYKVIRHQDLSQLPFEDRSFDLVWNFAALWHVEDVESLLSEMARVSANLILIAMPNRIQAGYILRKYIFDRSFFETVNEHWARTDNISRVFTRLGYSIKERGVMDVPPWPDTCIPIRSLLAKFKMTGSKNNEKEDDDRFWTWDIMSYYLGGNRDLKQRIERLFFLERMPVPWRLKALWAHHNYLLFSRN